MEVPTGSSSKTPISYFNPYCRQHLNTQKKTSKKPKDEMKDKPKRNAKQDKIAKCKRQSNKWVFNNNDVLNKWKYVNWLDK